MIASGPDLVDGYGMEGLRGEWGRRESGVDSKFAGCAEIVGIRRIEPHPMDYVLLIGRPVRRERQDRVIFDLDPVVSDINRAYWNGQEGIDLPVFICVREPVDVPERIVSGIDTLLLQLLWLPRFDKSNPVGDIPQKTLGFGDPNGPTALMYVASCR